MNDFPITAKKVNELEYNVDGGYIKVSGWGLFNTELNRFASFGNENIPSTYKNKSVIIDLINQYNTLENGAECFASVNWETVDRNGNAS